MWGSDAWFPRERLFVLSSLLIRGHCTGGEVCGKILSQLLQSLLMGIFFFFLVLVMRKRCSASLNFFQKKVLHRLKKKCASCRFDMSMAEGDT